MIHHLSTDSGRVVALRASGKLTHEDYRAEILPRLEQAMSKHESLRFLGVLDQDYEGITPHALWDEIKFTAIHNTRFERMAVVTDDLPVRAAVRVFRPLFTGEVRLYAVAEQDDAEKWIFEGIERPAEAGGTQKSSQQSSG